MRNLHQTRFRLTVLTELAVPVRGWATCTPSAWNRYCPTKNFLSAKEGSRHLEKREKPTCIKMWKRSQRKIRSVSRSRLAVCLQRHSIYYFMATPRDLASPREMISISANLVLKLRSRTTLRREMGMHSSKARSEER